MLKYKVEGDLTWKRDFFVEKKGKEYRSRLSEILMEEKRMSRRPDLAGRLERTGERKMAA